MKKLTFGSLLLTLVTSTSAFANVCDFPEITPSLYGYCPCRYWSGVYAGLNAGVVRDQSTANPGAFITSFPHSSTGIDFVRRRAARQLSDYKFDNTGFTGGAQLGFAFQFTPYLLLGLETDFESIGLSKTKTRLFPTTTAFPASAETATEKVDWLGTFRARVGAPFFRSRALLYATGGAAYAKVHDTFQTTGVPTASSPTITADLDAVLLGWSLGGGLEYGLTKSLSAKVEYLYYDFGSYNRKLDYNAVAPGNNFNYAFNPEGHIVRFGLNYLFGVCHRHTRCAFND